MTPRMRWLLGLLQVAFFGVAALHAALAIYAYIAQDLLRANVAALMGLIALVAGAICSLGKQQP